jgi:hypothetical protein
MPAPGQARLGKARISIIRAEKATASNAFLRLKAMILLLMYLLYPLYVLFSFQSQAA